MIHSIWDRKHREVLANLHNKEVLQAIIEGYLRNQENLQLSKDYGLLLVGICEKETINSYIVDFKGKELLDRLVEQLNHSDIAIAYTSSQILTYLIQDIKIYENLQNWHLETIAKLLQRDQINDEFLE